MSDGVLAQLPDLSSLTAAGAGAGGELAAVGQVLGALGGGDGPLAAVGGALGQLGDKLHIDVSGLQAQLPATMARLGDALPPDTLHWIETIATVCRAAIELLQRGDFVKAIAAGKPLSEIALAAMGDALTAFGGRVDGLARGLVDPQALAAIRDALAALDRLRGELAAPGADLLPLLARGLVGLAPDLLREPAAHAALLAPFDAAALTRSVDPLRDGLASAAAALAAEVAALDPGDGAAYRRLLALGDDLERAVAAATAALGSVYKGLQGAVAALPWSGFAAAYRGLLDAIDATPTATLDDVVARIDGLVSSLARGVDGLGGGALASRVAHGAATLRQALAASPLGQLRGALHGMLVGLRTAIERAPTQEVQAAVEQLLGRIEQELDALGIERIAGAVAAAFQDLERFVGATLDDALGHRVRDALDGLLAQLRAIPIGDLLGAVGDAVGQLKGLIDRFTATVDQSLDSVKALLARLDALSFKPVGDEVVGEIDEVKKKLKAIRPDALSEVEKLAIKAALAVVQSVDLEGKVVDELKKGFAAVEGQLVVLLDEVAAALGRLRDGLNGFGPEALLAPVDQALRAASSAIERANGELLVAPLRKLGDELVGALAALAPGQLLDPLQGPYATLMGAVRRLDPAQWLSPLDALYAEVDRAIAAVDLTALFDELERREPELLASARTALAGAFDGLQAPAAAQPLLDALRALAGAIAGALLGEPVDLRLPAAALLAPLDAIFDQLMAQLGGRPAEAVAAALEALRQGLGVAIAALEPAAIVARLRDGAARLAELSPAGLAAPLGLARVALELRARVGTAPPALLGDAAAAGARLDALVALTDGTDGLAELSAQHALLVAELRRRADALDLSDAGPSWAKVRDGLARRLPAVLFAPQPVGAADVTAALAALRPSLRAAPLAAAVERLFAGLAPVGAAIGGAIRDLFGALRDLLQKDDVRAVYDAVRAKVRVIDTAAVADAIRRDLLEPLTAPLAALDPATLKAQLDAVFERARQALAKALAGLLDDVAAALDGVLAELRADFRKLSEQIEGAARAVGDDLAKIVQRVEELVLVELIERLKRVAGSLEVSFDKELDRVRNEFDQMLAAIPLGDGAAARA